MTDDPDYALIMPFVVCQSKGGPYEDDAYAAGWEAATIDANLANWRRLGLSPIRTPLTVRTDNMRQIDLVAMHRGYEVEVISEADGWTKIEVWTPWNSSDR